MLSPERRAELRGLAESAQPFIRHGGTDPAAVCVPAAELTALLDAADERDRLAAQVERVRALADGWQSRGEHMMAYSKTPEVPGDMADALLDGGAEFVERARLVRNALDGADE